jgi:uncharacterized membrane protein YkvA (DUF1232 family)
MQAAKKLNGSGSEKIKVVKEQLALLIDLLTAFVSGEYRDVSSQAMVSVVGAIIYFVVPLDGIPDFLFGWGFLDDAAVISYVISQISAELGVFQKWQDDKNKALRLDSKQRDTEPLTFQDKTIESKDPSEDDQ